MNEIAKCPLCGETEPYLGNVFGDITGYGCCGVECQTSELWNQYATGVDLAKSEAWRDECDSFHRWRCCFPHSGSYDEWDSVISHSGYALDDARRRVLKVFGGE